MSLVVIFLLGGFHLYLTLLFFLAVLDVGGVVEFPVVFDDDFRVDGRDRHHETLLEPILRDDLERSLGVEEAEEGESLQTIHHQPLGDL